MKTFDNLKFIDRSLNKYAPALMTLFPGKFYKDWNPGYHTILKKNEWGQNFWLYCTNSPAFKNLSENDTTVSHIDRFTYILDCSNKNKALLYFMCNRGNPFEHHYIIMNDDDTFTYLDNNNNEVTSKIRIFNVVGVVLQNNPNWKPMNELECYRNADLVKSMKSYNIRHNLVQSKGGKCGLRIKLSFNSPNGFVEDEKNALDAYKIATTYGYKKGYRQFSRDIKIVPIHLNKDAYHSLDLEAITVRYKFATKKKVGGLKV
jgi:hypothetical protein